MHARHALYTHRRERLRSPVPWLGLAIAMLVAACGQVTSGGAVPPTTGGNPTGAGTPVSGVPQTLGPAEGGQYETVLASGGITYLGSGNGTVYAFQSSGGKPLWQRHLSGSAALSAVVNQVVYAEASGENSDTAYALDAATGAVLWHYTFPTGVMDLAISGGTVFANDDDPSGAGSTIYALRASDGSLLWRYTAQIEIPQPIEAAGGVVYAEGSAPSGVPPQPSLYALRASDGKLLWTYQTGGEFALPTVANGIAYLAVGDGPLNVVEAVDSATGKGLWRFTAGADQSFVGRGTIPTVANGVVYVAASSMVYALRASDGHVLWRASRANTGMPVPEWPVVGDGAVYFKDGDSGLAAVRASDGLSLWHQHVGNIIMGVSEEQGLIQALTQSNVAYGLRASDGALLWKQPIDNFATWDRVSLPYAVAAGILFVATEKGTLQAIRAADGALLWHDSAPPPEVLSAPVYEASVTFASGVRYEQALREVTDLGLMVATLCEPSGVAWNPLGQGFGQYPGLIVDATPMAEPNWLTPLRALPGVASVQPVGAHGCPLLQAAPPGTLATLAPDAAGTLVRLTFTGQTSYEAALDATITLGFRLTNPCYERLPQGAHVMWTPMGQEHAFAQSQALLVRTTTFNSTAWQQQARGAAGVTRVEVQPAVVCATP